MTWSTRDRPTPRLRAAVKAAYLIFAPYQLGPQLATCRCPQCMDDWTERKLLTTQPQHIGFRLLCEYTWSANGSNEQKFSADELRHFLPRYFHFIAYGLWPNFGGEPAPTLRQLGHFNFHQEWPPRETEAIEEFFSALFERALNKPLFWGPNAVGEDIPWSEIEEPLCAIAYAGGDLPARLKQWELISKPEAALHLSWTILHSKTRMSDGKIELWDAFWQGRDKDAQVVVDWLYRPETVQRLNAVQTDSLLPREFDLLTQASARLLEHVDLRDPGSA